MDSWLKKARTTSNLSIEECASQLCQSKDSYLFLEENPGVLSLNQINALLYLFNYEAKQIVWLGLRDLDICKFDKHG